MAEFITQYEQVSPQWLTDVLRESGALEGGQVIQVDVAPLTLNTADAFVLDPIAYSADATGERPERLFLKIGRRYSEVSFYRHVAPRTTAIPLVRCYHAVFANARGQSNLLFDDISRTHAACPADLPPRQTRINDLVGILAGLHRQWWEHPDLRDGELAAQRDDVMGFVLQQTIPQFGLFVDAMGDALSPRSRRRYERVFDSLPLPVWEARLQEHRAVTVVHGDAQFSNFLLPEDAAGPVYLHDWALWHVNLPTYDLAYMLARCYRDFRQRFEVPVLRQYHEQLGISGYTWEQCWDDYRMAVIYQIVWPVFFHRFAPPERWYRLYECAMSAFVDLACDEFL